MELKSKYQYIDIGIDVANTVRSTLGPRGMNKMVLKENNPILTNDGATIIKNLNANHPIVQMFKGLAEGQEKAIGDGTTTTTILAGQLLENAKTLLNKKIHPVIIINGYNIAKNESIKYILNVKELGNKEQIMLTTFGSKISQTSSKLLTKLLANTDVEHLKISKLSNTSEDSEIIQGYSFEGYTLNDRMPSQIEGKVAVLDLQANMDFAKFSISQTEELDKLENRQKSFKKDLVNKLKESGVKAVFYTDTNPQFENFLTDANLMSVVIYRREHLDGICKATNAKVISDPSSDVVNYLGNANVSYNRDESRMYITSEESKINTLILKGPTDQVLDETERAIIDVMSVLKLKPEVVLGAGNFELKLADYLINFSKKIGGKEQAAIEQFANAVESIPLILAENCGFDAVEIISLLKAQLGVNPDLGVDAFQGISNARTNGVFEPASLKANAILSATEVANLILKLDDIYEGAKQ